MPKVSVIIPCYNQGQYLNEAVDSVLNQTFQDFEILIVNDGSTDEFTNNLLKEYNRPKTKVVHTSNQGLPSARNNGIREAQGIYILPLDADDKIGNTYLEKAVKILDNHPNIGIVYCEAEFFGAKSGRWELEKYSFPNILLGNQIFCSAFFKRKDWELVGGYKPVMKYGWEDYEFWLSLIEREIEVFQIPEILFYYRQKNSSMLTIMNKEHWLYSYEQIYDNHFDLYTKNISLLFSKYIDLWQKNELIEKQYYMLLGLQNSFSYKIGKLITTPFRLIRKLFRLFIRNEDKNALS
jgi:glycosyltransferase involved in cell wall biosynthesis